MEFDEFVLEVSELVLNKSAATNDDRLFDLGYGLIANIERKNHVSFEDILEVIRAVLEE